MGFDPATAGLIFSTLFKAIEVYNGIERVNSGLTPDQRAARKQLRKDMIAYAKSIPDDYEPDDDIVDWPAGGDE